MMRRDVILLVLTLFGSFDGKAMFGWYETKQVPIGRLFTNLQERLARDTNNFELTYDLARLHSMAYSTNCHAVAVTTNDNRPEFYHSGYGTVPKGVYPLPSPEERTQALAHLTNAIVLFERAIVLLKKS